MTIERLAIPDVVLITPRRFEDARGYFSETFSSALAEENGLPTRYVQDNLSNSRKAGTIRGLHFQKPPFAQDKLVRVLRGRILDVAVDIRKGSPWYGKHVGVELSADKGNQLLVPKGFAHAFCTLEDDTEVFYKVTAPYAPQSDSGIIWNDPDLAIAWPFGAGEVILSDKDAVLGNFRDLPEIFTYEPETKRSAA